MKTTFTSIALVLSVLMFGQTPMTIENLPDLSFARSAHIQIVTTSNQFTVIGGHVNGFDMTKNAEIYNSSTKTWTTTTSGDFRDMSFVAKLNNGKYLIGGGCSSSLGVGQLATSEIYDPANNNFTPAATMNVARTNVSAATLKDGRVLVVGNWYNTADNAEIYDPVANTFTHTGACLVARALPVIIPTNDGGAIVCGGLGIYGGAPSAYNFEKYNPVTNSFSELTHTLFTGETSWDIGCYLPTLTQQYQLPDGKYAILVYNTALTLARLISIDPATSQIQEIVTQKPIPIADETNPDIKFGCARTLMIDQAHKLIHIIQQASNPNKTNEMILRLVTINLQTGSVNSAKMEGFDYSIASSNVSMLEDGRILCSGGNKYDNFTLSPKACIITPATYPEEVEVSPMSIENLPDLTYARSAHSQIVTAPAKYVVIGGHINGFNLTKNAEIYNSTTKTWEIVSSADNRDMGFVAKLNNGKYLIGGGCSSTLGVGQLATSEIYDPSNNSFTAAANMNIARTNVSAATLKDGRVLVVGNWYNTADNAEVYDPVANTFMLTGACLVARALPVIIPTNDGGAIVCGGLGIYGGAQSTYNFEKYNPVTNSFSELTHTLFDGETSWDIGCYMPTMTQQYLMPDGKYAILVYNTTLTLVRLISIDPATSQIQEIVTQKPIPIVDETNPDIKFGCARTLLIDQTRKLIHIIQQASNPAKTNEMILRLVTINLRTGSVNSSKMEGFDYSIASSNVSMLEDGRILCSGGNKFDNFTLSPKACIITPARYLETSVNNPLLKSVNARWSNQDQSFLFNQVIESATMYNLTGKTLITVNYSDKLSANSLAKGIYIIKVKPMNSIECVGLKVIKP